MTKILVRLPNWLGDMVMSVAFIHQLKYYFPKSEISVIARQGLQDLLMYFPPLKEKFIFDKEKYKGALGPLLYGRTINKTASFDLFFCLPTSFSSALMGLTLAPVRIGYKKELRQVLLTHSYDIPSGLNRVNEYISLLSLYTQKPSMPPQVTFNYTTHKTNKIVLNINSEATSRRLTVEKAVELITEIQREINQPVYLIGASKEQPFVQQVVDTLPSRENVFSVAGKTTFADLIQLLAEARVVLSTDSGPAHLANALGTDTTVLFGAGNENNTAPYNKNLCTVIRLGKLSCEPCLKNECLRYGIPQCLTQLDSHMIVQHIKDKFNYGK